MSTWQVTVRFWRAGRSSDHQDLVELPLEPFVPLTPGNLAARELVVKVALGMVQKNNTGDWAGDETIVFDPDPEFVDDLRISAPGSGFAVARYEVGFFGGPYSATVEVMPQLFSLPGERAPKVKRKLSRFNTNYRVATVKGLTERGYILLVKKPGGQGSKYILQKLTTQRLSASQQVKLDQLMEQGLAGLGASKAQVAAQLEQSKGEPNTVFIPSTKSKYSASMEGGRFSWSDDTVYFDFFNKGSARRITIPLNRFKRSGPTWTLVPSFTDRWVAIDSEFAGDHHRAANTTMSERAAWNTVNEFISSLVEVMPWVNRAYARVILKDSETGYSPSTWYFWFVFPSPEEEEGFPGEGEFHVVMLNVQGRYSSEVNKSQLPLSRLNEYLTKEQVENVLVARDYALGTGGRRDPNAPLMG